MSAALLPCPCYPSMMACTIHHRVTHRQHHAAAGKQSAGCAHHSTKLYNTTPALASWTLRTHLSRPCRASLAARQAAPWRPKRPLAPQHGSTQGSTAQQHSMDAAVEPSMSHWHWHRDCPRTACRAATLDAPPPSSALNNPNRPSPSAPSHPTPPCPAAAPCSLGTPARRPALWPSRQPPATPPAAPNAPPRRCCCGPDSRTMGYSHPGGRVGGPNGMPGMNSGGRRRSTHGRVGRRYGACLYI